MGLVNVPKLREGIIVSVVIFQSDSSYSKIRDDPQLQTFTQSALKLYSNNDP